MHYKSVLDGVLDRISLHCRQCGINLHPIPLKIKEIDQEREVIYLIYMDSETFCFEQKSHMQNNPDLTTFWIRFRYVSANIVSMGNRSR